MNDGAPDCPLCYGKGEAQARPCRCLHERIRQLKNQEDDDIHLLASLVQLVSQHITPAMCSVQDLLVLFVVKARLEKVLREEEASPHREERKNLS